MKHYAWSNATREANMECFTLSAIGTSIGTLSVKIMNTSREIWRKQMSKIKGK